MRKDGIFIAVEVDDAVAADARSRAKLTEACPVDIFAQRADGRLEIVESNLDECVLCRLCLDAVAGRRGAGHQALRRRRRPGLSARSARRGRRCPRRPLSCDPETTAHERKLLTDRDVPVPAGVAGFLAEQLTAYH